MPDRFDAKGIRDIIALNRLDVAKKKRFGLPQAPLACSIDF
ncbi:hypothetical protein VB152_01165 [Xanthomonas fragariae]|nr:hypothetical protein [Xanthomonas fragariae]